MKKVRTLGTKRWVCAILVCALLLTTPSLALAAKIVLNFRIDAAFNFVQKGKGLRF